MGGGQEKEKILQRSFRIVKESSEEGKSSFETLDLPDWIAPVDDTDGQEVSAGSQSGKRFKTELVEDSLGPHSIGQAFKKMEKGRRGIAWEWDLEGIIRHSPFLTAEFNEGKRKVNECKKEPLQPQNGSVWALTRETQLGRPGQVVEMNFIPWQIGFVVTPEGKEVQVGIPVQINHQLRKLEELLTKKEGEERRVVERKMRIIEDFLEETRTLRLDEQQLGRAINLQAAHCLHFEPRGELRLGEEALGQQLIRRLGVSGYNRLMFVRVAEEDPKDPQGLWVGTRLALVNASARFHANHYHVGNPQENIKRCFKNPDLTLRI